MSDGAFAVVTLVAVSVLIFGAAAVASSGYAQTGVKHHINDETFTPQTGSFVALNLSNHANLTYSENVTVKDENGNLSVEGDDFEWNSSDGTIQALAGGELDGDSSATIDYTVYSQTDTEDRVLDTVTAFIDISEWVPLLLLVGLVVIGISMLGRL